jgi:pteridine reductase
MAGSELTDLYTNRLEGRTILITGSARRIGQHLALTAAYAGGDVIIHHAHSSEEAEGVAKKIRTLGRKAWTIEADLASSAGIQSLIQQTFRIGRVDALINNAAIFENQGFFQTSIASWERHLSINLTAPFLLCQAFASQEPKLQAGRIINIVDWRALRPGADHFSYTISKAALAAMTKSLAATLAPQITVNAIAFGAVLPPNDGAPAEKFLHNVPSKRLASLEEVSELFLFLLTGPAYMTGEIIHLDGGRHLY